MCLNLVTTPSFKTHVLTRAALFFYAVPYFPDGSVSFTSSHPTPNVNTGPGQAEMLLQMYGCLPFAGRAPPSTSPSLVLWRWMTSPSGHRLSPVMCFHFGWNHSFTRFTSPVVSSPGSFNEVWPSLLWAVAQLFCGAARGGSITGELPRRAGCISAAVEVISVCQAVKSLKRPVIFPDESPCIQPRGFSLPLFMDRSASLFWTAQMNYRNRLVPSCPTLMHGHQTWKYRTCQHKILPSWALPPFPGTWKCSASKWTSGGLFGCEFSAWKYIHSWPCSRGLILICFFSILHPSEHFLLDGGRRIVLIQTPFSKSESLQTALLPSETNLTNVTSMSRKLVLSWLCFILTLCSLIWYLWKTNCVCTM